MAIEPTLIKPRDLPDAESVSASDWLVTDGGVTVSRATPTQVVDAVAPVAPLNQALLGNNNNSRMTPLRVRQVLDQRLPSMMLFDTRAQAEEFSGDLSSYSTLVVFGYHDPGDGGMAVYSAASEATPGSFSVGGVTWNLCAGPENIVCPEMFGAVADGVYDCTPAFHEMQAYCDMFRASVGLSVGEYLLTEKITFNLATSIYGKGAGITRLSWGSDATSAGVEILLGPDPTETATVRDVTFMRRGVRGNGTALKISGAAQVTELGGVQPPQPSRVFVSGVDISGASVQTSSWNKGLHLESIKGSHVSDFKASGSFTGSAATMDDFTAILLDGEGNPVEFSFTGIRIKSVDVAVDCVNTEGVLIVSPNIVQARIGVRWRTATPGSRKPHLDIRGGHISSLEFGVDAVDLSQSTITGVLFYQRPESTTRGAHIQIDNGIYNNIGTNTFSSSDGASDVYDAIRLIGGGGYTIVDAQNFQKANDAITIGAGSSMNIVRDGSSARFISGDFIVDNGTATLLPGSLVNANKDADQEIPSRTPTRVEWSSVTLVGPFSQTVSDPDRFVVDRDVRAQISATATFEAVNDTGIRRLVFLVNGVSPSGSNAAEEIPVATRQTIVRVNSGVVDLKAGDVVSFNAYHTAGTEVDLIASGTAAQIAVV